MSNNCTDKAQCQECSRQHPTLLHYENKFIFRNPQEEAVKNSTEQEVSTALVQMEAFGATGVGKEERALAVIPVRVKAQKGTKEVLTYAFLDPDSSATESLCCSH